MTVAVIVLAAILAAVVLGMAVGAPMVDARRRSERDRADVADAALDEARSQQATEVARAERLEQERHDADARAEAAATRAEQAEARAAQAETQAAQAETQAADAEARVAALEGELTEVQQRHAEAERRWAEAESLAARAEQRAVAAEARLAITSRESAAEAGENRGDGADSMQLWTLELLRAERTWRQNVALGPDEPSPFAGSGEALRLAVESEVAAMREEVGVDIALAWKLAPVPEHARGSLLVLRAAHELLASSVRFIEAAVLRVEASGDDVLIVLDPPEDGAALPPIELPWTVPGVVDAEEHGVRVLSVLSSG